MGAGVSKFDKDARDEFMNNVHNVSEALIFALCVASGAKYRGELEVTEMLQVLCALLIPLAVRVDAVAAEGSQLNERRSTN